MAPEGSSSLATKQEEGLVFYVPRVLLQRLMLSESSPVKMVRARVWRACEVCRKRKVF
jgi:hypothetical protein